MQHGGHHVAALREHGWLIALLTVYMAGVFIAAAALGRFPGPLASPTSCIVFSGLTLAVALTAAMVRAEGAAGIGTDELSVKGILQSQGTWIAMVAGPSGRVYTVHQGDRIADGTIRGITPQFVLIVQQVNDPLSLEKQREVRKLLRGGEEVK